MSNLKLFKFNPSNNNDNKNEDVRKNIWLVGRFALNEKEAAIFIINEARHLLKVRTYYNVKVPPKI